MRLRGSNCWVRVGELPDNLAVPQRPMLPSSSSPSSSSYRCRWVAFSDHPGAPVRKCISFLRSPYACPEPVLVKCHQFTDAKVDSNPLRFLYLEDVNVLLLLASSLSVKTSSRCSSPTTCRNISVFSNIFLMFMSVPSLSW